MKSITDVLSNSGLSNPREKFNYQEPFEKSNVYSDNDIAIINDLFDKLISMRPAYLMAWPTTRDIANAKNTWMHAFRLAKISDGALLQKGLDELVLMDSAFIPSPGQFIKLCQASHIKPTTSTMDWNLLESWKTKTPEEKSRIETSHDVEMAKIRKMLGMKG